MTTTEQEIDAMSGPQLERLIAETQGWHLHPFTHRWYDPEGEWTFDEPPKVTSDPAAAWDIQSWLQAQRTADLPGLKNSTPAERIGAFSLEIYCDTCFICEIQRWRGDNYVGLAETPELAQARAAAKCLVAMRKERD